MIKLDNEAKKLAKKALLKPKFIRTQVEQVIVTMYKRGSCSKVNKNKYF